ncbi:uncharacterized protein LOC130186152 [Seriola aureovittata]|uniref:uncharacterized protein LOC130186152 n=1 Tax=Seriola aureovittata TaxID=2871759 RepID=UPI0024BE0327|nr:uncharacterized protein LOC130186152 [Seriola aureovittata]
MCQNLKLKPAPGFRSRGPVAKHVTKRQSNTTYLCECEMRGTGCGNIRNMQAGEKQKTWDSSRFRQEHMTFWPRSHPVMFPHLQTDHWSKMKTMAPGYLASVQAALLKDTGYESHERVQNHTTSSLLPPLTQDGAAVIDHIPSMVQGYSIHHDAPKTSPQNMPQYRNVFNDRARRGFCYWVMEKKGSTCKGYSFGAYKTSLGLPKV